MQYIEPIFRPPSEANSLILQVTNGCSWNHCAFCEMYTAPQKKFSTKNEIQIKQDIAQAKKQLPDVKRIFLADGDAMVLSTRRLLSILSLIKTYYPDVKRISSYCLPRNVKNKSVNELQEIHDAGLSLVYVGAESGDDQVLNIVNKGESYATTAESLQKLHQACINSSVMLLNGLGRKLYTEQHAINSAHLINDTQPKYLATLVVSFPLGTKRFMNAFSGQFEALSQQDLFKEMEIFLEHTQLKNTIFRSDHASNYLVLKGILGKDKQKLLDKLRAAQTAPNTVHLRQEWERGL